MEPKPPTLEVPYVRSLRAVSADDVRLLNERTSSGGRCPSMSAHPYIFCEWTFLLRMTPTFESMHCPYLISTVCIACTSTPVGWHLIWRPSACPFCMCDLLRILERVFGHSHLPWGSPMLIWNSANTYPLRGCSPLGKQSLGALGHPLRQQLLVWRATPRAGIQHGEGTKACNQLGHGWVMSKETRPLAHI